MRVLLASSHNDNSGQVTDAPHLFLAPLEFQGEPFDSVKWIIFVDFF
jgi:hypothetical protein